MNPSHGWNCQPRLKSWCPPVKQCIGSLWEQSVFTALIGRLVDRLGAFFNLLDEFWLIPKILEVWLEGVLTSF